jgi:type VI secretion system Hcp family effector
VFDAGAITTTGSQSLFLEVAGLLGEAREERHRDWIEIEAVSFGGARTFSSVQPWDEGETLGIGEVVVLKYLDRSSPALLKASQDGQIFPSVIVEAVTSGGQRTKFLQVRLESVVVSSFRHGAQTSKPRPLEEVGFRFSVIRFEYYIYNLEGALVGKTCVRWDQDRKISSGC